MEQTDMTTKEEYVKEEVFVDIPFKEEQQDEDINEDDISDVSEQQELNEDDPFVYLQIDETDDFLNLSDRLRCGMNMKDDREPETSLHSTQKTGASDEMEVVEELDTKASVAERNVNEIEEKSAAPILRRSARLSRGQIRSVNDQTRCPSKAEKMRQYMTNCHVVLNRVKSDKNSNLSTTLLRRSPRNIRRVCYKDDEDGVDDVPSPPPARKSHKKKINSGPKVKATLPSHRITRSMSTGASVNNGNNAAAEKREKVDKNIGKKINSPLHRRSTVQEPMSLQVMDQENQETTVHKSVHVSKNKPRARLACGLKKWFTEASDNEDQTFRKSSRTTTRDTHILPGPCQRVTRSMTRSRAEETQTARPKRRYSVCSTYF